VVADVGTSTDLCVECNSDRILIATTPLLEKEASDRMQQPPPSRVTPPKQKTTTAECQEGKKKNKPDYSDGYGLFGITELNSFLEEMVDHAAACGKTIEHVNTDFSMGAGITMTYKCACSEVFVHKNCKWSKSGIVEEGRHHERSSPELNRRIVKAARETGINLSKVIEFLACIGVKTSDYRNILHQEQKVRQAIKGLTEKRMVENMREHNIAARSLQNYVGDLTFVDAEGHRHSIAQGAGSIDGAGLTRAYSHRIKGTQAALIIMSSLTHKPLMFVHTQVSVFQAGQDVPTFFFHSQSNRLFLLQVKCILCTRAYNKANKGRSQVKYIDDINVMKHEGKCYRNSKHGPAISEEYACVEAARRLLIDENGVIRPDDEAVFLCKITTDNDTRGKFIARPA